MAYTLPAEWSEQSGIMLTWPHIHSDWKPYLEDADKVFAHITKETSLREKILITCNNESHRMHVAELLSANDTRHENIIYFIGPSNDSWARDHGPITALDNGTPVILDFQFNGWGGKYAYDQDNQLTRNMVNKKLLQNARYEPVDMVLEGGSIEVNGNGVLMTSRQCLLSKTRNPHMDQTEIENRLSDLFNVDSFIWLEHGHLQGDDTDSHIDTLARFCDENTIIYTQCDDKKDIHFDSLNKMENELHNTVNKRGGDFKLVPVPLPDPVYNREGARLPATYVNFLIINGAVLAPVYGCGTDKYAMEILRRCFPDRDVIEIDCRALIEQYGSLHCVTMQFPDNVL